MSFSVVARRTGQFRIPRSSARLDLGHHNSYATEFYLPSLSPDCPRPTSLPPIHGTTTLTRGFGRDV